MAIKPVTFNGATNFASNLYALEIRSRFADQSAANGYYMGYGEELAATVSGNEITVGSGALLVQGRLCEITDSEAVSVDLADASDGCVCVRIETHPEDAAQNCTLTVKRGGSVSLAREDTYALLSETENRVYELPLYSFSVKDGALTTPVRRIKPIAHEVRDAWYRHHVAFRAYKESDGEPPIRVLCDLLLPDATPITGEAALREALAEVGESCCTGYIGDNIGTERALLYSVACNIMREQLGAVENTGTIRVCFLRLGESGAAERGQRDFEYNDSVDIYDISDQVS